MSILSAETEALIKDRAASTGRTPDEIVREAFRSAGLVFDGGRKPVREKLSKDELLRRMREIADHAASLPILDPRSPDEIIGYDEFGLPT